MFNWEYNFLEKHLGKTKFWKLYEGNRVFRYIFKVLAVILMFLLLCANFYIKNMIGILEIPVSIIVIFIYIFLLAMVVNIRSDTTLMVALRFFLDSVIILAMVGLLCFLITNNIFPRLIL
ncbi:MAG TPA: hypothetical protein IAD22_03310 [Candidatus Limousia pullorum]|uniref:Uncharacterized protein n=1 Tax=Candidatus Limousia pullorum TaxID=2840860 RepID=A0A9D1LXW7_9FIRM|nr:hypothetical protein [Candidatus Limousia pullorum]